MLWDGAVWLCCMLCKAVLLMRLCTYTSEVADMCGDMSWVVLRCAGYLKWYDRG